MNSKNNFKIFLLILLCLIMNACAFFELDNPAKKDPFFKSPKLVVHSFIAPQDTILTVAVGFTFVFEFDVTDRQGPPFDSDTVTVTMSSETETLQLIPDPPRFGDPPSFGAGSILYRGDISQLPIVPGQEYAIEVVTLSGNIASGACRVPLYATEISQIESTIFGSVWPPSEDLPVLSGKVFWNDIQGEENFYFTNAVFEHHFLPFQSFYFEEIYSSGEITADRGKDGFTLQSGFEDGTVSLWNNGDVESFLIYYLLTIDRSFYLYLKSLENYEEGNPFTEPTRVYSNIQNGLGIFAAYQKDSARAKIQ